MRFRRPRGQFEKWLINVKYVDTDSGSREAQSAPRNPTKINLRLLIYFNLKVTIHRPIEPRKFYKIYDWRVESGEEAVLEAIV